MLQVGDKVKLDFFSPPSISRSQHRDNYFLTILHKNREETGLSGSSVSNLTPKNNVRNVISGGWRRDETLYAAKRQEQDGDQYGFCHEAKSFLTFGGVPCRTITPNGIGSH